MSSELLAHFLESPLFHAFLGKPICLAYAIKEKYIGIGFDNGKVSVISKNGQVKEITHEQFLPVKFVSFCNGMTIGNETFLLTALEENPIVFLWRFSESKCVSKVALTSMVTVLTSSPKSPRLYVGTDAGDVVIVDITDKSESDSLNVDLVKKSLDSLPACSSYGRVVAVNESDQNGHLLIVFSSGKLCIERGKEPSLCFTLVNQEIPVAAWWKKSENAFVTVCRSGNVWSFSCNLPSTAAYPKLSIGNDGITMIRHSICPATKEMFIVYAGGAPVLPQGSDKSHILTMLHTSVDGANKTSILEEFDDKVVDFMFLPRREEPSTKPLLAVLTESELVILDISIAKKVRHDLDTLRYSRSTSSYPYITSPVTSLQYCGECSQEFLEEFASVLSLTEGKKLPELVVTGHCDGFIRLWLYNGRPQALSFELLSQLVVNTECYFEHVQEKGKQLTNKLTGVSFAKVIDSKHVVVIKESKRVLLFDLWGKSNLEVKPTSSEVLLRENPFPEYLFALPMPSPYFCPCQWQTRVRLLQHFSCHYQSEHDKPLVPVTVNCVDYNDQMKIFAVGTEIGLIVLDTQTHVLVNVVGSEKKLLKLCGCESTEQDNLNVSENSCDAVCVGLADINLDDKAQLTLWVGTRGGTLGAFNVMRETGKWLELKSTGIGKHYDFGIKGIHFHQSMEQLKASTVGKPYFVTTDVAVTLEDYSQTDKGLKETRNIIIHGGNIVGSVLVGRGVNTSTPITTSPDLPESLTETVPDTLPDVELLAETKFLFSEDKSAAVHCWEDYGLNLHVPEGSSANFRVRVVHSKTFVLPKETELVSPFYWVTSEGELTGSVGVEIQHCVHITDKKGLSSLQFAAYKVEKPEPPYVFKECDSHFSMTSNYGRSDIKFSNWVFALLRSIKGMVCLKQRFQARLYYEPYHEPALQYECIAHLVIVPDTNACQRFVQERYGSMTNKFVDGAEDKFFFEDSKIKLTLKNHGPLDSVKFINGWTIKNENSMVVSKEQANSYRGPLDLNPRILRLTRCNGNQKLDEDIVFEGSEDSKFLTLHQPTIICTGVNVASHSTSPLHNTLQVPTGSVAEQEPSWSLLISIKKPDGDVVRINTAIVDLHDKDKCIQFAHLLLDSRVDVMKIVNDSSEKKDFVRAVLDKWLSSGSSSWQHLVDSMRGADMDKSTTDKIAECVLKR